MKLITVVFVIDNFVQMLLVVAQVYTLNTQVIQKGTSSILHNGTVKNIKVYPKPVNLYTSPTPAKTCPNMLKYTCIFKTMTHTFYNRHK